MNVGILSEVMTDDEADVLYEKSPKSSKVRTNPVGRRGCLPMQ